MTTIETDRPKDDLEDDLTDEDDLIEEETLVEEISIDGMCGVY